MKRIITSILLCFCAIPGFANTSLADTPNDIKQRLRERLPMIDDLKLTGKIGENNQALLEARESLTPKEREKVEAQNADRNALYAIIANQNNTTIKVVASQRAEQIAKQSKPGIWLQKPNGEWYKK